MSSSKRKIHVSTVKKPLYTLLIDGVGSYGADSLIGLAWTMFKHRCKHLFTEGKWRD